jgi:glycosyltransferase involved in cell wall biosynthesis
MHRNEPLVSVIIPAYNCESFISSAIDSVLAQTYKNYELIVVDDGSIDETRDKILKYNDKIKYIYQVNGGVAKARNTGIKYSRGSYIAFLDADDIWEKYKLEIQMSFFMKKKEVDLIFCNFRNIKNKSLVTGISYEDTFNIFKEYNVKLENIFEYKSFMKCGNNTITFFWGEIYKYLFLGNFILPSSVLFKKYSLNNVGLLNENFRVAEETEFFLRYSMNNVIGFIDHPLLYYELPEQGNLSGKKNTEKLIKNALKCQINFIMHNNNICTTDNTLFKKGISMTYCRLAYYYLSEYRIAESRKYALYGISTCMWNTKAYIILLIGLFPKKVLSILSIIKQLVKNV